MINFRSLIIQLKTGKRVRSVCLLSPPQDHLIDRSMENRKYLRMSIISRRESVCLIGLSILQSVNRLRQTETTEILMMWYAAECAENRANMISLVAQVVRVLLCALCAYPIYSDMTFAIPPVVVERPSLISCSLLPYNINQHAFASAHLHNIDRILCVRDERIVPKRLRPRCMHFVHLHSSTLMSVIARVLFSAPLSCTHFPAGWLGGGGWGPAVDAELANAGICRGQLCPSSRSSPLALGAPICQIAYKWQTSDTNRGGQGDGDGNRFAHNPISYYYYYLSARRKEKIISFVG